MTCSYIKLYRTLIQLNNLFNSSTVFMGLKHYTFHTIRRESEIPAALPGTLTSSSRYVKKNDAVRKHTTISPKRIKYKNSNKNRKLPGNMQLTEPGTDHGP